MKEEKVIIMAYCRKCGAEIDDEAVVCPKCGVPQEKNNNGSGINGAGREYYDKNRTTAAILAIFLGGIGAHKFYMGYNKEGVVQLLLSLLFGLGWILAVIEGIIYISKSEADFQATYINGDKGWL